MKAWPLIATMLVMNSAPALATVDVAALCDFSQPAVSEQRSRAALATAQGDEALAMQLQLEAENDVAGTPDGFVFDELVLLYRARGDKERAAHFAQRRAALPN